MLKTNKLLIMGLGVATIITPAVAVVACDDQAQSDKYIDDAAKVLSAIKVSLLPDDEFKATSITNRPLDGLVAASLGIVVPPFNGVEIITLKYSNSYEVIYKINSIVNIGRSQTVKVEFLPHAKPTPSNE